jgi:hypothetical protein
LRGVDAVNQIECRGGGQRFVFRWGDGEEPMAARAVAGLARDRRVPFTYRQARQVLRRMLQMMEVSCQLSPCCSSSRASG